MLSLLVQQLFDSGNFVSARQRSLGKGKSRVTYQFTCNPKARIHSKDEGKIWDRLETLLVTAQGSREVRRTEACTICLPHSTELTGKRLKWAERRAAHLQSVGAPREGDRAHICVINYVVSVWAWCVWYFFLCVVCGIYFFLSLRKTYIF